MKPAECHKHKNTSQSFSDSRNLPDSCRGCQQRNVQCSSFHRSGRSPEAVASYYSSSTSYKPAKGYSCSKSMHSKCMQPHNGEALHHGLQTHLKLDRSKHYPPNAVAKSKIRYEDGVGNEKLKYADELENLTEDNRGEDAEEEEDDHADGDEFLNKEYDEHEADDEIEEESDPSPQTHRAQRACKKEMDHRQQRWKSIDQQQDPRRLRCQQRVLAVGHGHSQTPRYYYHEHEVPEPLSEEDFVPTSMKNIMRRSMDYHQWSPSRESNRYDSPPLHVQSRRTRTKPDVDQFLEAEFGKTRKCHRCGTLSNRKFMSPLRNSCRFDERVNFPTKGPIGDEPESRDQLFCGNCILRHSPEDINVINDVPTPQFSTKSYKSRDTKSPKMYQMPASDRMEHLTSDSRNSSRYHRKPMDHEKIQRSLHNSYGPPHLLSRYED
ncbi:uncharacterized protein LOC143215585 [Lasioglossum baleicum]|uniref:uncharacterized protein LOC143215585 n=1 Tax=Lasioglossum baleicum TaxID=434251 RepID=UPI003FCE1839